MRGYRRVDQEYPTGYLKTHLPKFSISSRPNPGPQAHRFVTEKSSVSRSLMAVEAGVSAGSSNCIKSSARGILQAQYGESQ